MTRRFAGVADSSCQRIRYKTGSRTVSEGVVTVVVTCYNQGHFLRESIGSILSQTRLPDEILLVDDGSTDNTRDEVRRFPEVIYIRQDNSGLAAARNTGLRRSRGDLLVFLDADDRLLPQALEAGLDDFAAHPECAFVFGAFRRIDATGKPLAERAAMRPLGKDAYLGLLRNNQICMHATAMFRQARARGRRAATTPRFPPARITICTSRLLDVFPRTSTHGSWRNIECTPARCRQG